MITGTLDVKNCAIEKIVKNAISSTNNLLLPILSARFPTTRLPARPISVPAPRSPTQNVLSPRSAFPSVTAVPAIPSAKPHAICPKTAQRNNVL